MRSRRQTERLSRSAIAALLTIALLFTQWLGLWHRVVHADRLTAQNVSTTTFNTTSVARKPFTRSVDGSGADNHSCAAFDAATLADLLDLPHPRAKAVQPGTALLALWVAFASWDAPLAHFFSSRAPPLA